MDKLVINFLEDNREVELEVQKNGSYIDQFIIPLDRHFDTLLVTSIDKLLKRNRIDISDLNIEITGRNQGNSTAAHSIAKAVVEALKVS